MLKGQETLKNKHESLCSPWYKPWIPVAQPESFAVGPSLPASGLFVAQSLDSRSQLLATEPTAHNPRLPGTTDFLLLPRAEPASLTSRPTVSQQPFVYLDNVWGLLEKEAQLSSRK